MLHKQTLFYYVLFILSCFTSSACAIDVNFNVPVNVTDYPGKELKVYCTAGPQTTGVKASSVKVPLVNGTYYGNVQVTVKNLEPKDVQSGVGAYVCQFEGGSDFGSVVLGGLLDQSKPFKKDAYGKF